MARGLQHESLQIPIFEVSKIEGPVTGQDELGPGTCSVSACFPAELGADDFLPAKGPRGLDNRCRIPGVQEEIAAAPLLVEPTESAVLRVTCSLYLKPPLEGDKQGPCKANVPRNFKMVTRCQEILHVVSRPAWQTDGRRGLLLGTCQLYHVASFASESSPLK